MATFFLHGNAGNVAHRVEHALAVLEAGSSVLVPDYRGYGESSDVPDRAQAVPGGRCLQ